MTPTEYTGNQANAGWLPSGTKIKTRDTGDGLIQAVDIETNALATDAATETKQDAQISELQAMNLLSSVVYDEILVTYTDATKAVISKVEWKLSGDVVKTLTPTFGATTDDWVKS